MNDQQAIGQPVVLVILDGWGIGRDEPGNAILAAHTPTMDRLLRDYPCATLSCSGQDVGLPAGQMGNSEVGHLNLGAGYIVRQGITRIDHAIATGEFSQISTLIEAIDRVRSTDGALHLIGLLSDGGVHSHFDHLIALLDVARARGLRLVEIHAITDGRDTSPRGGIDYVRRLESELARIGLGRIATVSGRYYAMDRDKRWERTARGFRAIALGEGPVAASATAAIATSYDRGVTDEFVIPTVISVGDRPSTTLGPNDTALCFNFRADRMRQLVSALSQPDFAGFDRGDWTPDCHVVTMTHYSDAVSVPVLFSPENVTNPLARVLSESGLRQFHAAETEKYAHVTYFLNGGRESPFPGEERALVPSPKVATYDLQPGMSASAVTDNVIEAIDTRRHEFVIVNFANCDMVGHTGVFAAAVAAVEAVDACLRRLVAATLEVGGVLLITADHGNAEEMIDRDTGRIFTAHTTNPVPIVFVAPDRHPPRHDSLRPGGVLAAVAPTVLDLLSVQVPQAMTERSLLSSTSRLSVPSS